jgi:hypothetical protein
MPRKQTNEHRVNRTDLPTYYPSLLAKTKHRIRTAQVRAAFSANAELIHLYWDIGRAIEARQQQEGWGAGIIPRLARDLHNERPEVKGCSERNLKYMIRFYREYPNLGIIGQPAVAQLPSASGRGQPNAGHGPQGATTISPPPVAKSSTEHVAAIVQPPAALSVAWPGPAPANAIVPQAVA